MVNINDAINSIEKRFGKEAISGHKEVKRISSGSIAIDYALGGGYPRGRIIEIMGWESSGKTTIALHEVVKIQEEGKKVVYIDTEHAIDPFYCENLGIKDIASEKKNKLFYLIQPDSAEEGFEIAKEFLKVEDVGLVVFDSVAAMKTRAEIEGEAGDVHMGTLARLMAGEVPKIKTLAHKNDTLVIFINQFREKIGVMFGNPTTTPGGNSLKFYASIRMEVARSSQSNKNKDKDGSVISNHTKVKIIKNKVAPPFKVAEVDIKFGIGIDFIQEVIDMGVNFGIIEKKGAGWMNYKDTKLGQGDVAVIELLKDNPELYDEIHGKVLKELNK